MFQNEELSWCMFGRSYRQDAKVAKRCGNQSKSTNDGLSSSLASCPTSLVKHFDFTLKDQAPHFQLMRLWCATNPRPDTETQPKISQSAYPPNGLVLQDGQVRGSPTPLTTVTGVKELSLYKDLERWWDVKSAIFRANWKESQTRWNSNVKWKQQQRTENKKDDIEHLNEMILEALKTLNTGHWLAKTSQSPFLLNQFDVPWDTTVGFCDTLEKYQSFWKR